MTATATATRTRAQECVVVDAEGQEVRRYGWRDSARRAAKSIPGATVVPAAEFDAQQAEQVTAQVAEDADGRPYDTETGEFVADFPTALAQHAPDMVEELDTVDGTAALELLRTVFPAPAVRVRDAEQLADTDEMTGTDYPEVKAEIKKAARRDDYAARTETGPMVEVNDGDSADEWSETRSYFTWRVAVRRGRFLATHPTKAVATRVVDQDGAVLWTSAADEGVRWALENGKHLKTFTQQNADTAEKAAALFS